ncbi:CHAT domain-containing protein, partial [Trichocoleus sp. FACHB-262]|uniref:CHAT domain-containing protein n=1 Tax=Trichocoleus sp. FACHB-262 TaxID=2692869 RepID=UPI001683B5DE
LAQAKELGDHRSEAFAEGYLGQFAESQSQWFSAQGYTQSAVAIAEEIIAPDIAYQWHWQLGRLLKQQDQIPLAIKEYEMAIANLNQVRNNQISLKNSDIQFSFRDQVEPVYRQLIELLLSPSDGVIAPDQSQLEKARKTLESLQLAELENYLRCTLQPANPKQLDSLSDQNGAAILYPIILPKQVAVIAKLPGLEKLVYFAKPVSESEVRTKLTQLRYILEQDLFDSIDQEPAKTVYKWLIQPLEASENGSLLRNTKTETLVFVPDGQFRNIPMAALKDPITDRYLIENYAVTLHLNLELKNPQPLYQHPLITLAAGITKELGGPEQAEVELTLLQEQFSAIKLSDERFTLKNLQQQINSHPYTIVHIASHGDFTSQPETTGIKSATGLINLNEIKESFEIQSQARPEPIELLVLSACRTADGDRRAILGLAGIAVQSGARSTLASLWYVDDESTSDLMQRFYTALKEKSNSPFSKAELLQSVQKQLIKDPSYSAPLYWAPFVLLGNWL